MNIWHSINKERITKDRFIACIEISSGSHNKYELDKETGFLILDRVLYTSTHYPANYGFIPRTYAQDNDPLDVLVLTNEKIVPMTLVECRPIGVMHMTDGGDIDDKIIAVCVNDPFYNHFQSIKELPTHVSEEIKHFFRVYKQLEGKKTIVDSVLDDEINAKKVIQDAIERYNKKFTNE